MKVKHRQIEKIHISDSIKKIDSKVPKMVKRLRRTFQTFGNILPRFLANKAVTIFLTPFFKPKRQDPKQLIDLAKPHDVTIDDLNIRVYEWGVGIKTVLLVHGWESRACFMTSFLPRLLDSGYRVIAFDGPAHGLSDGEMTNMVEFGNTTYQIAKQFGPIDSMIVHSFGGPSTVYTLAQPETALNVDKMVIIGSPNDIEKVVRRFAAFFTIPEKVIKHMILILEKKLDHPLDQTTISYNLPKTKLKDILLIHDELDDIVPYQDAIDVYESNLNTSLILTKGLGHSKIKYADQVIEKVIDFIK